MKRIVALGDVIFSIDYLAVAKIAGAQEILRSGSGFPLSAHRISHRGARTYLLAKNVAMRALTRGRARHAPDAWSTKSEIKTVRSARPLRVAAAGKCLRLQFAISHPCHLFSLSVNARRNALTQD